MTKALATLVIAKVEQLFDLLSDKRKICYKMKLNVMLELKMTNPVGHL